LFSACEKNAIPQPSSETKEPAKSVIESRAYRSKWLSWKDAAQMFPNINVKKQAAASKKPTPNTTRAKPNGGLLEGRLIGSVTGKARAFPS
jgi:hypothetical protein